MQTSFSPPPCLCHAGASLEVIMEHMTGKCVIVTGGASGFGERVVRCCAKSGAKVMIADVEDVRGDALAGALWNEGRNVEYTHLDTEDPLSWKACMEKTSRNLGPISALVCCEPLSLSDESTATASLGPAAVMPYLREVGCGSIVNITCLCADAGSESDAKGMR